MRGSTKLAGIWRRPMQGLKHASPTILSCVAAAGVIGTAVLAVRATATANRLLQEAADEKGEELTKLEMVTAAAPAYATTALAGVSTISCIIGANMLNKRQQATMASAYAMLSQTYQRYRKVAGVVYGEDADAKIIAEMAKELYVDGDGIIYNPAMDKKSDEILFFDSNSQRYFWATIPAVLTAMYHLNRNLVLRGDVSLNEFFGFLGIEEVEGGDEIGWDVNNLIEDGLMWLDFENTYAKLDDGLECCIISACVSAGPIGDCAEVTSDPVTITAF